MKPRVDQLLCDVIENLPYKLEMELEMEMPCNILSVELPNHPNLTANISGKKGGKKKEGRNQNIPIEDLQGIN